MSEATISKRQREMLTFIEDYIARRRMPPSRSEIARALGYAYASGVNHNLRGLERLGFLTISPGRDRGIQLTCEGAPIVDADELPAVAAGNPIVACDHPKPARLHDYATLTANFEARPDWFVRVQGDSLDKNFRSGEVLAVRRNPDPRDGDIVVARIGEEVVVKRFFRPDENRIELRPESHNPEHRPILIDPQTVDFEVVGTVVGAIVGTRRNASN